MSVDKRRITDVLYLVFRKDFDLVPCNILPAILGRYGFDTWNIRSIINWRDHHIPNVTQRLNIQVEISNEW